MLDRTERLSLSEEAVEREGDAVNEIHLISKRALIFSAGWLNFRSFSPLLWAPECPILRALALDDLPLQFFPLWNVYQLLLARFRTQEMSFLRTGESSLWKVILKKDRALGLPGGSVVKNPSASAGDVGLISDPGRFPHACRATKPRSQSSLAYNARSRAQLLSPCAAGTEALSP